MKLFFILVLIIHLTLWSSVALAAQTTTYVFTASSKDVVIPIITNRSGDIFVSADFVPNNHGLYVVWIKDGSGKELCSKTEDFRWGRMPPLPLTCQALDVPAGSYLVVFRAAMGGKVNVTLSITAETN